MTTVVPVAFDVRTQQVLDLRSVGSSSNRPSASYTTTGLLRYETDTGWVYYDGSAWVPLVPAATAPAFSGLSDVTFVSATSQDRTAHGLIARGNIQTEDTSGNKLVTLDDDGSIQCVAITAQTFETSNGGIEIANECININSNATPATNDAIRFSHGRILSQSNQIMLQSLTTYMIIKGDLLVYEANRHHYFYGQNVYFNNTGTTSDDRLKWEETPITNGLGVINQLQPHVYWKGRQLNVEPTPTERRRESGFIAQEVEQIPELAHAVSQSEDEERSGDTYFLDYTQLHAYHVAATQELSRTVLELQERVAVLEAA